MEYCPRTLSEFLKSYNFKTELACELFRQILQAVAYIHGKGIMHRDLTPKNIFLDASEHIKVGDFGLAKFLNSDQEPDIPGVPVDGKKTGTFGALFYAAPEILQSSQNIDEKCDMYSLGVILFELWHPFGTGMERYLVLSELTQINQPPLAWSDKFPEQASLLYRLISPIASDRPSATELLDNPPGWLVVSGREEN